MSGAGYTPAFGTMLTGTLFGKWPHNGIWALLLTRCDRRGFIDETPECIAAAIGIPVKALLKSIDFFMQPDSGSRTPTDDGRRLELIDPTRSWGWRVINHGKYREKARLMAKSAREVEDGANASRMADRRGPPETAADRPSEAKAEAKEKAQAGESAGAPPTTRAKCATRIPDDFKLTDARRQIAVAERVEPERTFAKFCDYWRSASGRNARKLDWDATWRNWCRTETDRFRGNGMRQAPRQRAKTTEELEAIERERVAGAS